NEGVDCIIDCLRILNTNVFNGTNDEYWTCVSNIGRFLEINLRKMSNSFIDKNGINELINLSYNDKLHPIPTMLLKNNKNNNDTFGSTSIPQLSNKVIAAQRSIANSYQYLKKDIWPQLINKLFDTFNINYLKENIDNIVESF